MSETSTSEKDYQGESEPEKKAEALIGLLDYRDLRRVIYFSTSKAIPLLSIKASSISSAR
jgi:hypothetical protein